MREKPASVEHVCSWTELDRMLGECDIVVLSCALTPETTGLIDGRRLAAMNPSAFLVNLARGAIAEEQALYRALRDGVIGGAALDTPGGATRALTIRRRAPPVTPSMSCRT
jgi:D-3-phosphoglycerate dehydrogenase / 2-oxoglutarate reductase